VERITVGGITVEVNLLAKNTGLNEKEIAEAIRKVLENALVEEAEENSPDIDNEQLDY